MALICMTSNRYHHKKTTREATYTDYFVRLSDVVICLYVKAADRSHKIYKLMIYRVFIKYCVFPLKCCDFSELCQFFCSAGVLPANIWKSESNQSSEYIFKFSKKTTKFNEHPVA